MNCAATKVCGAEPPLRWPPSSFCLLRLAVVALGLIAGAFLLDGLVVGWIRPGVSPTEARLAQFVSKASDWPVVIPALLAISWALHAFGARAKSRFVLVLALAATLSGGTATAIRSVTGRARPSSMATPGFYGPWHQGRLLIGRHEFSSFPSGHVGTVAGVAGALLFYSRRAGAAGLFWAVLVAWSRLVLNRHYFSDVITALLLGVVGGWLAWNVLLPYLDRRRGLQPPGNSSGKEIPESVMAK